MSNVEGAHENAIDYEPSLTDAPAEDAFLSQQSDTKFNKEEYDHDQHDSNGTNIYNDADQHIYDKEDNNFNKGEEADQDEQDYIDFVRDNLNDA
ncbi:hypothetical protein AKO1_005806 [Acrasis kona]|uniref:Uncharacterized protein n=1 Tax=Acrasis kona TaxID=1008807 RepID=A0AAW2YJW7_9EUKA